ncbi:MAG TPA: hypothetical protein VIF12_01945 [Micavibrio sp.]|jgi:hypothetical protein
MKNPVLSLYSRCHSAFSYAEGLKDSFRLSAEKLAKKEKEKDAALESSMSYALSLPLVQPCHDNHSLPPQAVKDFIKIRKAGNDSYKAGLKAAEDIKAYLECL